VYSKSPLFSEIGNYFTDAALKTLEWTRNTFSATVTSGTHTALEVRFSGVFSDTFLEIKFSKNMYPLILEHCAK
jgi:hypothetical protein